MSTEKDYLYEDPEIPSQKYSLVTIIGPHAKQKCSVWGMKVRGCAQTLEAAKKLSARLNGIDPDYDIYTVETGKFFPLVVDPNAPIETEYSNSQLNSLIKGYSEEKEKSDLLWEQNKNSQVSKANKEGKTGGTKRTPELVYNTISTIKGRLTALEQEQRGLIENLEDYENSFEEFTDEERRLAIEGPPKESPKQIESETSGASSSRDI